MSTSVRYKRRCGQGCAGHRQHLEGQPQRGDLGIVFERQVTAWDLLAGRAADPRPGCPFEFGYAADMIVVVMGDEDILQLPAWVGLKPVQHRLGVTRIDHRTVAFGSIL